MYTTYPHHFSSAREPITANLVPFCIYCHRTLGKASATPEERRILESNHSCVDKLVAKQPAAPVPFH